MHPGVGGSHRRDLATILGVEGADHLADLAMTEVRVVDRGERLVGVGGGAGVLDLADEADDRTIAANCEQGLGGALRGNFGEDVHRLVLGSGCSCLDVPSMPGRY